MWCLTFDAVYIMYNTESVVVLTRTISCAFICMQTFIVYNLKVIRKKRIISSNKFNVYVNDVQRLSDHTHSLTLICKKGIDLRSEAEKCYLF